MITSIGSCDFPSAEFELGKSYNLPSDFADEEELKFGVKNYFFRAKQVAALNRELPYPQSLKDSKSIVRGAESRFPPEDIRYFVRIGGGANRIEEEKEFLNFLRKRMYKKVGWIPSPPTVLKIGKKKLFPWHFRELVRKVKKAVVKRRFLESSHKFSEPKALAGV